MDVFVQPTIQSVVRNLMQGLSAKAFALCIFLQLVTSINILFPYHNAVIDDSQPVVVALYAPRSGRFLSPRSGEERDPLRVAIYLDDEYVQESFHDQAEFITLSLGMLPRGGHILEIHANDQSALSSFEIGAQECHPIS